MTNFAYITGIPATNNNPSDDQPDMMDNNDNAALIWNEDHIGFNAPNGGLHRQSAYPAFSSGIVPIGDDPNEGSVAFPAAGLADTTRAQYYFRNVNNTYCMSTIRAFGVFKPTVADGAVSLDNGMNVASITQSNTIKTWTIVLSPGVTTSNNVAVFINSNGNLATLNFTYTFDFTTQTLVITTAATTAAINKTFSFQVLQL